MEELLDEGWLSAVHPDDVDRCAATYGPAFEARTSFLLEYRARRADGVYRWLLTSGVPKYAPDGSFAGYLGCDVDITERKDAEERICAGRAALEKSHREIQHLAGRLIVAQDVARARLARDLHDDVSQQLAGLSIALSGLRRRMEGLQLGESVHAELRALHDRAILLAQNVRQLSHDLHPTVLRHAGLVAALTSYCAELKRLHGTVLRCSAEGEFASISPEAAICLYRIAQEALRNVIVHAGASRAELRLLRSGDDAELTIVDDGRGFDVGSSLTRGKGLGLVSISERANLASGTVSITSEPGVGTRVHVRIPIRTLAKGDEGSRPPDGRREYTVS
jgi:signal transduction histidine kinase